MKNYLSNITKRHLSNNNWVKPRLRGLYEGGSKAIMYSIDSKSNKNQHFDINTPAANEQKEPFVTNENTRVYDIPENKGKQTQGADKPKGKTKRSMPNLEKTPIKNTQHPLATTNNAKDEVFPAQDSIKQSDNNKTDKPNDLPTLPINKNKVSIAQTENKNSENNRHRPKTLTKKDPKPTNTPNNTENVFSSPDRLNTSEKTEEKFTIRTISKTNTIIGKPAEDPGTAFENSFTAPQNNIQYPPLGQPEQATSMPISGIKKTPPWADSEGEQDMPNERTIPPFEQNEKRVNETFNHQLKKQAVKGDQLVEKIQEGNSYKLTVNNNQINNTQTIKVNIGEVIINSAQPAKTVSPKSPNKQQPRISLNEYLNNKG